MHSKPFVRSRESATISSRHDVGAGLGTVGAGLGTVGAGLGTVGAGLGTVGAGLGTKVSYC